MVKKFASGVLAALRDESRPWAKNLSWQTQGEPV
jgi:hypothetical protein